MMHQETRGRSLRIGMVAPPWFSVPPSGYGGIEWMCYWLVEGLIDLGHQVTLIAAGTNHTRAGFVRTLHEPPSRRLGETLPEALHASAAAKALSGLDVDVVHDHSLLGPLHALGRATPTVITTHGTVDGEMGAYLNLLGGDLDLVAISASQQLTAPHLPWAGMVHNGIPVKEYPFSPVKQDFVLFLGRLSPEKGAALAIDAARSAGLPIVVAAKCNEPRELRYFEEEIKPRLGSGVEYIGEVGQEIKKRLLATARCLVFPIQWNEPFGIVMVEAMACGTPVVALRGGSVDEVIVDGVTGTICPKPADLAGAIVGAQDLDGAACRAHAETHFDVSRMVSGYVEVYTRAIAASESSLLNEEQDLYPGSLEAQV